MKKDQVLKSIMLLQAVCMIVLAAVVVTRVISAPNQGVPQGDDKDEMKEPAAAVDRLAATVGSVRITDAELIGQLRSQYGSSVLRTLMVRAAIRLEAHADNLTASAQEIDEELAVVIAGYDSEQQYYASMKEQLGLTPETIREDTKYKLLLEKIAIRSVQVSEDEVDSFIDENKEQLMPRTQYRLAWIVTDNKKDAEELLRKLERGEDFALMAKTYSKDRDSADSGGDLGLIDENDPFISNEILSEAANLEIGETTGPIPVDGGQAIIRLLETHTTGKTDERLMRENARKQVALSKASPLNTLEDNLLAKYNASIK
ncbi:peptidylprolyl isomerase [Paenibacillus sp. sptzw28]|uniref:peptidylprolyl isomerase n=1 Tax=Paenibacillus sp. sptzw28 TaxID=715179 RepID=UPI001C6E4BFF|nr:peptidylprolyl isomerase [Paenibacillus sp. sptzw28]QYR21640.1 peptidylprolyl isomerase [Paenibacillus sp. sptzw28]